MRPLYETADSLRDERGVMALASSAWKCEFQKLSIKYHLDYVLTRNNQAVAFCEVKARKYTMVQIHNMGGYLLSLGKWSAAKALSESSLLPFMLLVQTLDGIWYVNFKDNFIPDGVNFAGRTDRGDWHDVEPCVIIDATKFKRL